MSIELTKSQIYDTQIEELMAQIINICQANGIAMIADFDISDDDNPGYRATTHLPNGEGKMPFDHALMRDIIDSTTPCEGGCAGCGGCGKAH